MAVSSLWIFAKCLFIRHSPGSREYQAMVAPLGPSGQPQSLTAHRAIGKQSVGHVEALEPGRLPDIPRIPDGWDQGRLLPLSSATVYRAPEIGGARFSGSPIEVGFRRSAAAWLRNKLRGSRRSAVGRVSRTRRLRRTVRNCTRDEGGPFEVGSQVQVSSHRELLSSRAIVVSVAETPGHDPGRQG
jgi:hypothetical protein